MRQEEERVNETGEEAVNETGRNVRTESKRERVDRSCKESRKRPNNGQMEIVEGQTLKDGEVGLVGTVKGHMPQRLKVNSYQPFWCGWRYLCRNG